MAKRFIRPAVAAMTGYVPGEQPQERRYIKLNSNENPYPPSPRVIAAVRAAAGDELRLYPDPLANALRDRAAAVYGVRRENILVGNGSDELLNLIVRTCVGPGERVVYPYPTYSLYDTLVALQESEAVHVAYPSDFSLPAGLVEARGRVTFICHPNSPSGTAVPIAAIRALAEQVAGLLVVDEAYVDFAEANALALVRAHANVVVLRTFSKSFSLAGMRIGLAFAAPSIIGELLKVKDSYNVTRLSIVAATAALEDYGWMQANVARIRQTRQRLTDELRRRNYAVLASQSNFVLARRPGRSLEPVYAGLKARGILVRYFPTPELADALRITVGTDEEVDALLAALDDVSP
ncbi:MAG TPA: histidinol-phosphate transaminase [Candidatus Margulisiibacteriota bacterium]|nr:histidinol-phosphate transaminase [Candidatus Margulisiibacteriota bacterium]